MLHLTKFVRVADIFPRVGILILCAGILVCGTALKTVFAQGNSSGPTYTSTGDNPKVVQEVVAAEKKLKDVGADDVARAALYASTYHDVHGSGWLYTKSQSVELGKNQRLIWPNNGPWKVIKSSQRDLNIDVYGNDTAIVTGIGEIYVEVPNPEDVAIAAGTLTRDPAATARAIANRTPANTEGPGEIDRQNPYRARFVRVWVRQNGQWVLAISQSTRIGGRDGHVKLEN